MSLFGGLPSARDQATDPAVRDVLVKEPLAVFPAALAVVRVEDSGYCNREVKSYGTGRYSVVTTHDVETPKDFERLQKLPLVKSVAPLNRLLLPENLRDGQELRKAAAELGSDMLLVYTFDTTFTSDDWAPPLKIITLGLFPTYSIHVSSTASLVVLDVRNGFVYGCGESSAKKSSIGNAWTDDLAVDSARKKAEREALDGLLADLEKNWGQMVVSAAARPLPQREIGWAPIYPVPVVERRVVEVRRGPEPVPEGKRYRTVP
jgi:hypothetical protein